jgi:hypothetical protein
MRTMPRWLRAKLDQDPFYHVCALRDAKCGGRVTWEHAIIFAGKQVNEPWAIVPLCEYHHEIGRWQDAGTMDKQKNIWVALNRATDDELRAISKAKDWISERARLNGIYGNYQLTKKRQ